MTDSRTDLSGKNSISKPKGDSGVLDRPLPFINDPEGDCVPGSLPFIVDGHVHLFPDPIFSSVWKWFDEYGWPIRYKLSSEEIINFLLSRGINHIVALHYAHKPGMSRELNAYMANLCSSEKRVSAMATRWTIYRTFLKCALIELSLELIFRISPMPGTGRLKTLCA